MEANSRDQLASSDVVRGGVVCHPQPRTRGEVSVHPTGNSLQLVEDQIGDNKKHLFKTSALKNYFFVDLYRKPDITKPADRGTAFLTNVEVERADDGGGKVYRYATFLTAAHVLYSFDRIVLKHSSDLLKEGEALESVGAFVDLSKPPKYRKGWYEVCRKFTNCAKHTAGPYDYGAIFVEKKYLEQLMGQNDISLGGHFIVPQSRSTHLQDVFVAGYPKELHSTDCTYLASGEGKYLPYASESWTNRNFIEKEGSSAPVLLQVVDVHTADTMPGMSGSPVVVGEFSGALFQAEWTAIAIHVGGQAVNGVGDHENYTWSHDAPDYLSNRGRARGLNFAVPVTQQMIREIPSAPGKPTYDETDYGHPPAGGEDKAESVMEGPPPAKKPKFAPVGDANITKACATAMPARTATATNFWLGVFRNFCSETSRVVDLKTCRPSELDTLLSAFYVGMRNKKDGQYKKASYLAARAALSRHMVNELNREDCNIIRNSAFAGSNTILDVVLKTKLANGDKPAVKQKGAISAEDMEKLRVYFEDVLEVGDPVKLCYYCWLNITAHFALRGNEVQCQLKKSDIVFQQDSAGSEYAIIHHDFLLKNCPGGLRGCEVKSCGQIQQPKQVEALRKLLKKLHPDVERLFQRALPGNQAEEKPVWFAKMPLGHYMIGKMLPRISDAANLSRCYTNHSVRATSVTAFEEGQV